MPEQLQTILWMAEEIDFNLKSEDIIEARTTIQTFLNLVANPALSHWLY